MKTLSITQENDWMQLKRRILSRCVLASSLGLAGVFAQAQDIGSADPNLLTRIYPGKAYSPYAERSFPNNIYWGETHLTPVCLWTRVFLAISWVMKMPTALPGVNRSLLPEACRLS